MQINKTSAFLNDRQLAARYGVHRTTVWRWVRLGTFPAPEKISEGCSRWRDDVIAAHEQRTAGEAR